VCAVRSTGYEAIERLCCADPQEMPWRIGGQRNLIEAKEAEPRSPRRRMALDADKKLENRILCGSDSFRSPLMPDVMRHTRFIALIVLSLGVVGYAVVVYGGVRGRIG
jgi:hypothetical protein